MLPSPLNVVVGIFLPNIWLTKLSIILKKNQQKTVYYRENTKPITIFSNISIRIRYLQIQPAIVYKLCVVHK